MKIKHPYSLTVLSLLFLCIPNMNLIDILPDCIAYAIFAMIIGSKAKSVPYLAECKSAVIKLALITLVKIPAFTVMYSNIQHGTDIIPLFTLSFAVIEIILIFSAVRNLFLSLDYLGERTDCISARGPFKINRVRVMSTEMLEKITLVYFTVKATLNVLPEFMVLSNDDFALRKQLRDAYPAVLVISILASLVIGLAWFRYAIMFVKHLKSFDDIGEAIRVIETDSRIEVTSTDKLTKKLSGALNLLAVSSLFIFDISFQNFGGYNILPHFIYGLIILCAVITLSDNSTHKMILSLSTVGFAIAAIIHQSLTSGFFNTYQYIDLKHLRSAKEAYAELKVSAVFECVLMLAVLTVSAIIIVSFIKAHTETSPDDPSYTLTNKREHARLIRTTLPLMILSGIINVLKCVNVFLKENVTVLYSATNPEGIVTGGAPALNTVIFLLSLSFVVYSFVAVSNLKDAVKFKYSK